MELRTYLSIPGVVLASLALILYALTYIRFSEVVIALLVLTTGGS